MKYRRRVSTVLLALSCAASAITLAAPAEASGLNLHRGSRGTAVKVLETRLNTLGLLRASAVDRRFRTATVRAVRRFQRQQHLKVTGRVNQRTWNRVASEVARRTPPPAPAPLIVGHRGAVSTTVPENTLASMRYAAGAADVLEFDLRFTADRAIVLMHDATLDRTTNCTGQVSAWTLGDLRAQCSVQGEPIPTFDEVASFAAGVSVTIAPELKPAGLSDGDLTAVDSVIDAHGLAGRTYVQSFYPEYVPRMLAIDGRVRMVYLATSPPAAQTVRAAGAGVLGLQQSQLTPALVASYHGSGLRVWTWTARTTAALQSARAVRVDAVVTDIPREARALYHPAV